MEEKTSILLVDDHPENLRALEAVLEDLGQNIVTATSAPAALKCLMQEEFAVILLDVQMPDMDGFEAASLIRQREKSADTPIIFLTALNTSDFHMARGYASGAVDYLFKPFDPAILKAKVSVFVEMAKKTQALQREIARRRKAEDEVKLLNRNLDRLNKDLERRVQERTARIEALNQRLQQMVSEMHDRVRNNLQMLAAMMDLQIMEDRATIPLEELERLQMYIRILSTIHDILTDQTLQTAPALKVPIHGLLPKIMVILQQGAGRRKLSFEGDEAYWDTRQGTSLALIAGELSSNAIKHSKGEIHVTFRIQAQVVELQVCDQGPGFAPDFSAKRDARTGLHLVENLTRHDLNGQVQYSNRAEGGACVIVRVPLHA